MNNEEMKRFEEGFKDYKIPQWILEEEKKAEEKKTEEKANIIPCIFE